ncbi:hypothetical protein Tco_1140947, partial [Tanacetum coccineum]
MDNPNITMEEYIRLEEIKAQIHGRTFNWQTATFGKVKYYEDEDDCFTDFETEFPAIVFDNTLPFEPMVSPNENKIDFRKSLDESDDEDYTVEGYTEDIVHNYEQRLETIWGRSVNRVHVLDFDDLTPDMRHDLAVRLRMVYTGGDGQQAPEKVTGVDLFYLRSIDRGTANVPHLLAHYLFRHADGRKSGARLSGGHFIRHLAVHFGLVSDEGLRGLQ